MAIIKILGAPVATYKDIVSHFGEYKDARQAHIDVLNNAMYSLMGCYKASLKLDSDSWLNSDGLRVQYLKFGRMNGKNFEQKMASIQEDGAGKLSASFFVLLDLQPQPGVIPSNQAQVLLILTIAPNAIHMKIGEGGPVVEIPMDGDDSRFDAACAAISQSIMGMYRLSDFPQV